MHQMSNIANSTNTLLGLAKIMRLAFVGDDLAQLTKAFVERIQANALDAAAMLDLSVVLQLNAQPQLALELQTQALQLEQVYTLQSNPVHPRLRLLAIMGPGEVMANTPLEFLVEESNIALQMLYVGEGIPAKLDIPKHDVAFVAVCESDRNQALLKQLGAVMRYWPCPYVNSPSSIAQLTRSDVAAKLRGSPHVVPSLAVRVPFKEVLAWAARVPNVFPCIIRPVNSHAGHGLAKVDDASMLMHYVVEHVNEEYFIAPFIDYRSQDGWYRKYRVAVIDGQPFAAHMAISQNWMVHYLNADMLENARNRDEEAEFMRTFEFNFSVKHREALHCIDRCMALDYYSIDCAEMPDGSLLVFEVDSGAVVHAMDPVDVFPYKLPQMTKVFAAFQAMLHRRRNLSTSRAA